LTAYEGAGSNRRNAKRRLAMSKPVRASAVAAVICLALTGQAFAHAHLVSATPPVGGAVETSPPELDLKFSEALNLKFSGVKVTSPDKAEVKLDEPMLMDSDTTFMATIPNKLAPGTYTVDWHALSADGHKTHGTYTFTVKP
jgi:methionine-rich copper-binding protein CopC